MNENLKDFTTAELVTELKEREGVIKFRIDPSKKYELKVPPRIIINENGPAIIMLIILD